MKHYWLFLVLILCFFSACERNVDVFEPVSTQYLNEQGDITNFFTSMRTEEREVFPVEEGTTRIVTSKKTIIDIPGQAFVNSNGQSVTTGIELHVLELNRKGQMILQGQYTLSGNKLTESTSQLKIEAYQSNEKLSLAPGKTIHLRIPDELAASDSELFYGNGSDPRSFTWAEADGNPELQENVTIQDWTVQHESQIITGFGYSTHPGRLGWMSVAQFQHFEGSVTTGVCIELPESYTNENTVVYLMFMEYNTFITMTRNELTGKFCDDRKLVPVDAQIQIMVISEQESGKYHFASVNAEVEMNHLEMIFPEKVNLQAIKEYILQF